MTPEEIVGVGREALFMAIQVAGPILIVGLIVGLMIGIFQATTQIQEMTLVFVPKLVVMVLLLLYLGKWIGQLCRRSCFLLDARQVRDGVDLALLLQLDDQVVGPLSC